MSDAETRRGRSHLQYAIALLLDLLGAAGALLVSLPTWQAITVARHDLTGVTVDMTGRDVDSASTALGLVALAGVVAVLATRGLWRRVVGGVLALAGLGLIWRSSAAAGAVGSARARSFVEGHRQTFTVDAGVMPHIAVHAVWPVLSVVCGVLVLASGVLVAARGGRWQAMSARYEAA
ncbi:MAG: Trp biosynthesis-associated membrane protein, partial [Actinomycetota bacterium]|nr:Trp biosynthesis-associated membrane protein [Actinomycetota bacterium]